MNEERLVDLCHTQIGRYGTTPFHAAEDQRVISQLREALE
jgi:hypothetical protein